MAGVRRTFLHRWAQAGAKADPGDAKTDIGFIDEDPPYQWQNFWQGRADDMLAHVEEQAIPDWHVDTEYLNGALTMGSDRQIYKAQQANTGVDPTTDFPGTNWRLLVEIASADRPGVIELATQAEVDLLSDPFRAITPARLGLLTPTTSLPGVIRLATAPQAQALSETALAITPSTLGAVVASTTNRGLARLATAAEVLLGTATDRVVTPAALGALAQVLAATGYQQFPGGLIIQWGNTFVDNELDLDVTLPIAYPNAHLVALSGSALVSVSEQDNNSGAEPFSLTQIRLDSGQVNRTVYWISIGH